MQTPQKMAVVASAYLVFEKQAQSLCYLQAIQCCSCII